MAFNLSAIDEEDYFTVGSAVNVLLVAVLCLPPLLLCLLCVLALILAPDINRKITLLFVNIFAAEICIWISYSVFFLGFPARLAQLHWDYSCQFQLSAFTIGAMQKYMGSALYAINVYIFIKHGVKTLKWSVTILFVAISWLLSIATLGVFPYLPEYDTNTFIGICMLDPNSILFIASGVLFLLVMIISTAIVLICSILIYIFIKKNIFKESVDIQRAIVMILFYLSVNSVLTLLANLLPATLPGTRLALEGNVIGEIAATFIIRFLACLPGIATPVVMIAYLKPLRIAMKMGIKLFCTNPSTKTAVKC